MFKDVYFKRLTIIFLSLSFMITAAGVACLKFIGSESKQQYIVNGDIDILSSILSLERYIDRCISDEVKDFLRTASPEAAEARVREIAIEKHYRAYPDCQEHALVLKDAERQAAWYVAHKAWKKKVDELRAKWEILYQEKNKFTGRNYQDLMDMSEDEIDVYVKNLTPKEAASMSVEFKDWSKRRASAFNRYDEFYEQEPTKPKWLHRHNILN